jgi:tRNA A58 N-methylase Trm61
MTIADSDLNLDDLYKIAKKHKDTHCGCGAEPYLDYEKLHSLVAEESTKLAPSSEGVNTSEGSDGGFCILELGMGIGFTSLVMHLANSNAQIDTIETHGEHLEIAKNWFAEIAMQEGKKNIGINVIQADVHNILPYLETQKYDFIFFDVYGPKEKFLIDFERILKPGGILYSVNSHLKSAEENYFKNLETSEKWVKLDEFNDTRIYRKV